jgi:hypothetical protein
VNTKAIGAAAEVIFRAMSKTGVVPATIAVALDANNLLAGPDVAAEIAELRIQLATAERQARELDERLAERDEQIAGLLADEVDLSDDQPGVPR